MKRLFLAIGILLLAGCTPEPSFHGRPFSQWRQDLKSKEVSDRWRAADVMFEFGPAAKHAIPELIDCLHDEEFRVRIIAAQVLGNLGSEAKEAVPDLVPLLKDENLKVRGAAEEALNRIDSEGKRHAKTK
jgi:HEAT repeat protein